MNWLNEKNELERLINIEHVSYEEIGRRYNCTGANVKKQAKKLGILIPQRREINPNETFNKGKGMIGHCLFCSKEIKYNSKFCCIRHQKKYEHNEYIKRWKNGEENGLKGEYLLSNHIRRYMLEKSGYKCEICGWGEINKYTNTLPLEIHHIDGNYANNREENLQVLCPNHHSLTETHKSHNKNGRIGRKNIIKI